MSSEDSQRGQPQQPEQQPLQLEQQQEQQQQQQQQVLVASLFRCELRGGKKNTFAS